MGAGRLDIFLQLVRARWIGQVLSRMRMHVYLSRFSFNSSVVCRYGDPINPFGGLLKDKGVLMIGIPVGLDTLVRGSGLKVSADVCCPLVSAAFDFIFANIS